MATVKELRLRIKSLKNTKKITSAMKMVSASKLKKAKDASVKTAPYIEHLEGILNRVLGSLEKVENPFLEVRESSRTRYIVFSSDRGLCGGFNNNLIKFFARNCPPSQAEMQICTVGKRAFEGLGKRYKDLYKDYEGYASSPGFEKAKEISDACISDFLEGKIDRVVLCYNKFVSAISQKPVLKTILPFQVEKTESGDSAEAPAVPDYIFEPSAEELLSELLPKQISILLLQAFLDNAAGEHAARMTAMENATNNASELISTLTIQMNRARQAAITTELTEIVSGAESLKG